MDDAARKLSSQTTPRRQRARHDRFVFQPCVAFSIVRREDHRAILSSVFVSLSRTGEIIRPNRRRWQTRRRKRREAVPEERLFADLIGYTIVSKSVAIRNNSTACALRDSCSRGLRRRRKKRRRKRRRRRRRDIHVYIHDA